MVGIAVRMLVYNRTRLVVVVLVVAALFFLSSAQIGRLVGWCYTTSAIIRHADADIWVMAKQTPAFDYGSAIPDARIYQVRSVPGVEWAEGMLMAWNTWQRPDGRRVNVELVGLDDGCVGGPWKVTAGDVSAVLLPDTVVIDELFLEQLGVDRLGDEVEMYGQRAVVGAISNEVRTFTASPFVFTSIRSARQYDKRYAPDEITYVLARCTPGHSANDVKQRILQHVPHVDCLTSSEFALLTVKYWMLETGVGVTVVVTAILGLLVSAVVLSQTLFSMTHQYLPNYAGLVAIGFSYRWLGLTVLLQSLVLGCSGTALGSLFFYWAALLTKRTPIPLQTTPAVFAGLIAVFLLVCMAASSLSVRAIYRVDPATVFRV